MQEGLWKYANKYNNYYNKTVLIHVVHHTEVLMHFTANTTYTKQFKKLVTFRKRFKNSCSFDLFTRWWIHEWPLPNVLVWVTGIYTLAWVTGIMSSNVELHVLHRNLEQRVHGGWYTWMSSWRCTGAEPWVHLYVWSRILKIMCSWQVTSAGCEELELMLPGV